MHTSGPHTGRIPIWIRVLTLAPLGLFVAFVSLVALSFTGWGSYGMTVGDELRADAAMLGVAALSGATAGVLLLLAIAGRVTRSVIAWGVVLGCLPVGVRVLAYLTDAF